MVRKWIFGESYQSCGNSFVRGARPDHRWDKPNTPVAEIRECDDRAMADAQHLLQNLQRLADFLQRLAENDVIERVVGIVGETLSMSP